jgi:hypothetical protein
VARASDVGSRRVQHGKKRRSDLLRSVFEGIKDGATDRLAAKAVTKAAAQATAQAAKLAHLQTLLPVLERFSAESPSIQLELPRYWETVTPEKLERVCLKRIRKGTEWADAKHARLEKGRQTELMGELAQQSVS